MDFEKLTQFQDSLYKCGIPGNDIIVTWKGKTVYRHCAGFADAAQKKPLAPKAVYRLYSASKIFTCTCAMRLVEEGKLSLEDPVSKYLPEYANIKKFDSKGNLVPCTETLRVIHLFTMTGGMDYNTGHETIVRAAAQPNAGTVSVMRAMAEKPLLFEPGSHFRYSLCHDVLGAVIEVASGMRLGEYMKKVIFDPLDMSDMGFQTTEEQNARFCDLFAFVPGTGTNVQIPNVNDPLCPGFESGGGGLIGTVDDYIKLLTALSLGGTLNGYRLLKPETIAQMEVNRLGADAHNDFVGQLSRLFGYGWGLCGRAHMNPDYSFGRTSVGEFGWDSATGMYALVDRKNELALFYSMHLLSCNFAYHILHPMIRDMVCEALDING